MQQINLYQEQFRQRREPLRARSLAIGLLALLVVLAGFTAWLERGVIEADAKAGMAEQRRDRIEQKMLALRAQLERIEAEDATRVDLPAQLRAELAAKRRLMEYLEGGPRSLGDGFSTYLAGLARRVIDDLWFDRILVDRGGERLMLAGHALRPEDVPRMIEALGEEPAYAGHAFRSMIIERPEDADWRVDFLLSSETITVKETASTGTGTGRYGPYTERFRKAFEEAAQ